MKIFATRHLAVDVAQGICYGQTDLALREPFWDGFDQVALALPAYSREIRVFSSPLVRCRAMASYIYPICCLDPRLMELDFGEWEMRSWDEIYRDPRSKPFFEDYHTIPTPHGESNQALVRRVESWLTEVRTHTNSDIVLFTHGGVIRALEILINKKSIVEAFEKTVPYGHITIFEA